MGVVYLDQDISEVQSDMKTYKQLKRNNEIVVLGDIDNERDYIQKDYKS